MMMIGPLRVSEAITCYNAFIVELFFLQALSFHLNETNGKSMFTDESLLHDLLDLFTYICSYLFIMRPWY